MSAPSTPRRARPSRSKRSMNTLKKIAVCAGLTSASALLGLSSAWAAIPIQHWTQPNGAQVYLVESAASPSILDRMAGGFPTAAAAVFEVDVAGRCAYDGWFTPQSVGGAAFGDE